MDNALKSTNTRRIFQISCAVLGAAIVGGIVWLGAAQGWFTSRERLMAALESYGAWAPTAFIVIQCVQVVLPMLPAPAGCIAGVLLFGPVKGFIFSYIGICLGSLIAFLIAKRCGRGILSLVAGGKLIAKYDGWLDKNQKRFDRLFAAAIALPVAPDDFLCYLAGTTGLKTSKFVAIVLLTKPLGLALYSLGIYSVLGSLLGLL